MPNIYVLGQCKLIMLMRGATDYSCHTKYPGYNVILRSNFWMLVTSRLRISRLALLRCVPAVSHALAAFPPPLPVERG